MHRQDGPLLSLDEQRDRGAQPQVRLRRPGALLRSYAIFMNAPPSHNEVSGLIFDFERISGGVIDMCHTQVLYPVYRVYLRLVHPFHGRHRATDLCSSQAPEDESTAAEAGTL